MVDWPYLHLLLDTPQEKKTWLHHLHLAIGLKQQGRPLEEVENHLNSSVRLRKNNTLGLFLLNHTAEAWEVVLSALQKGGEGQQLRKEGEGVSTSSLARDVGAKLLGEYCGAKNWVKVKEVFEAVDKLPKAVSSRYRYQCTSRVSRSLRAIYPRAIYLCSIRATARKLDIR
jgi:hypothetical protein